MQLIIRVLVAELNAYLGYLIELFSRIGAINFVEENSLIVVLRKPEVVSEVGPFVC
jgi:hypothetical protein